MKVNKETEIPNKVLNNCINRKHFYDFRKDKNKVNKLLNRSMRAYT